MVGCSTVPIDVSLQEDNPKLNLDAENTKFPFKIAIVIPPEWSDFTLTSTAKEINIDYNFKYNIGEDFAKTLPIFFKKRFDNVKIISSPDNTNNFDYVFIPDINLSELRSNLSNSPYGPSYVLEINLKVLINKGNARFDTIRVVEKIERNTEIACWTCWGGSILNQQKIKNEYMELLSRVYSSLDYDLIRRKKGKEMSFRGTNE